MNSLSKVPVAILFSALIVASAAGPAAARTCKSWGFIGQAIASVKPEALVLARADWIVKVTDYWGVAWRNYNIASNKWEYCETSGRKQRCMAQATPCRADRRIPGPANRTN